MNEDQIDRVLEALDSIAERHDRECGLPTWKPEARQQMRAAVHAYAEEVIEQEREALRRINEWAKAYPLDVFPEPDLKRAHEVLEAAGLSLGQISAHAMRHVLAGVQKIAAPETTKSPSPKAGVS